MDTETLTPDLTARMDQISEDRAAYRVDVGWWVRTVNDDGSREWICIRVWMHGEGMLTGRKVVRLRGVSTTEPDTLVEVSVYHEQPVCCITTAQARRLGLPA